MKLAKRLTALLAAALLALMLPALTLAADAINLNKDVSLNILYQADSAPLGGAGFSIYLVAQVDEYGNLTATDTFKDYYVDITGKDDAAWRAQASTLEGYVLRDKIAPTDSGTTDKNGTLTLPTGDKKLTPGLYLVLGNRHTQGDYRYDATPAFIMLPTTNHETNTWQYTVSVAPKYEVSKTPSGGGDSDSSTVKRKVLKVWKDDGNQNQRPKQITVQLLRDGEIYQTVTLTAKDNWRYTWDNLSDDYKWTLVEKATAGYTGTVSKDGITFVVTNTYNTPNNPDKPDTPDKPDNPDKPDTPDTPDKPDTPDTPGGGNSNDGGDGGNTNGGGNGAPNSPSEDSPELPQTGQLWWPVPIMLFAGLLLVILGLMQRKGATYEK